jgi:adenylate cyclase class 2
MPRESEAKLKVPSHASVRRALRAAGAAFMEAVVNTDVYYDTPGGVLRRRDCGLRVRHERLLRAATRRPARRPVLTFKGPRQANRRIKVRQEHQTAVDDPAVVEEVLAALGLRPVMTIQKRRASYRLGRCRVDLDELPLLGAFVEIEGPTQRAILDAQKRLAITGPPILEPYIALLRDHCRRRGLPASRILLTSRALRTLRSRKR